LADINCKVHVYDARAELLSDTYPSNVTTHDLHAPELCVESANAQSYFLIMTHDHALDQQLCEAVLSRGDALYCGVIGSRTKGIKFRQRLLKKGFSQDEYTKLTCPMGLADLDTKKPMEIAVSVMAELLMLRNTLHQQKQHTKACNKQYKPHNQTHSRDRNATVIHIEDREKEA